MIPINPPIPGQDVTMIGGGSKFEDLPGCFFETEHGRVAYTRWRLGFRERLLVVWRGEIGMYQVLGDGQLRVQLLDTKRP